MDNKIHKKRGLDSEGARKVRQQGHDDDCIEYVYNLCK